MHPRLKQFVVAPLAGIAVLLSGGTACATPQRPVGQVTTHEMDSQVLEDHSIAANLTGITGDGEPRHNLWLKVEKVDGACIVEPGISKNAGWPRHVDVQVEDADGNRQPLEITRPATEDSFPEGSFRNERGRLRIHLTRPHDEPGQHITGESAVDVSVTDLQPTGYRVTISPRLDTKSKDVSIDCLN